MKSENAYRTIAEVSDMLNVPAHVLRFWETQFHQIKPIKRVGGRRYYRTEDIDLIAQIRDYLYKDGYTIKGVQKILKSSGKEEVSSAVSSDRFVDEMKEIRDFLGQFI